MNLSPLFYFKDHIKIVDQRKLPLKLEHVECRSEKDIFDAIKKMKIRGAPAIGVAGAFVIESGQDPHYLESGIESTLDLGYCIEQLLHTPEGEIMRLNRNQNLAGSGEGI